MVKKLFIDGGYGTTAIEIQRYIAPMLESGEIELVPIENHRDPDQRLAAHKAADLSILCLPDDIAKQTVALLPETQRIIDASSAHRTASGWVYGFPELSASQPEKIAKATRVTNPGCFATGAIAILAPLIANRMLDPKIVLHIVGMSGYSAGGKKLIEKFQTASPEFYRENAISINSPNAKHRHVDEIKAYAGLEATPIFMPHSLNIERGMIVSITFNAHSMQFSKAEIHRQLNLVYWPEEMMVEVLPLDHALKRINFSEFSALNDPMQQSLYPKVKLFVTGWVEGEDSQVTVHAMLDNLGKGAAAQAVQNMKLMLNLR